MNQAEFLHLHAQCVSVQDAYFAAARKTSTLLERCTSEPLSFRERFALLSQEILENEAYLLYLEAKRLLHRAALFGYQAVPKNSPPAAPLALLKS